MNRIVDDRRGREAEEQPSDGGNTRNTGFGDSSGMGGLEFGRCLHERDHFVRPTFKGNQVLLAALPWVDGWTLLLGAASGDRGR